MRPGLETKGDERIAIAERILAELERQTARALDALGREDADEVLDAVVSRDQALAQLHDAVAQLVRYRDTLAPAPVTDATVSRVSQSAARALRSHHALLRRVSGEHQRIEAAIQATDRPDRVAERYGSASTLSPSSPPSAHSLSLSG